MSLGLDMYSLMYITTLHSEYIYVLDKKHKEKALDPDSEDWIRHLRKTFQLKGAISEETAKNLLSEKKELEAKIDKIVEKEKGDKEQKIEEEKGEPIAVAEIVVE